MSNAIENGNLSASPTIQTIDENGFLIDGYDKSQSGLTKREDAAIKIMAGILSNPRAHEDYTMPEMVKLAINSTDLLFKELSK